MLCQIEESFIGDSRDTTTFGTKNLSNICKYIFSFEVEESKSMILCSLMFDNVLMLFQRSFTPSQFLSMDSWGILWRM